MTIVRRVGAGLARRTTRRGLVGRGAAVAFGALAGVAAGGAAGRVSAGQNSVCAFPRGRPCPCLGCQSNGVCAKPCIVWTSIYSSGCWTQMLNDEPVTCCDCDCQEKLDGVGLCGCGTDRHNDPTYCPEGTA